MMLVSGSPLSDITVKNVPPSLTGKLWLSRNLKK